VTEDGAAELRAAGLQALKIGEEAIVPLQQFALSGRSFKHLRSTVNRLARDGVTFELLRAPIEEAVVSELAEVSEAWLRDGNHRERAFSLGAFSRAYASSCDIALVRTAGGRIEAFANLVPSYKSGQGNFDMMRRRSDAPDGAIDFLFVGLIEHFRQLGLTGMNLGLAPLANVEGSGVVPATLRLLYAHGGGAFNFQGLRTFKEKWKPTWEARYLVYRSDVQLPALAIAVARAGERSGRLPISIGVRRKANVPRPLVLEG
jgi:phosphatidylglycerol lysyltransferase